MEWTILATMRSLQRDVNWFLDRPKIVGLGGLATAGGAILHGQFSWAIYVAVAEIGYGLWRAPTVCGASTGPASTCRNNGKGMVRGCWIQEHNEQRVVTYIQRRDWQQVEHHLHRNKIVSALLAVSLVLLVVALLGWALATVVHAH